MGYRSGRTRLLLATAFLVLATREPAVADGDLVDLTDPHWVDPTNGEEDDGPYVSLESFPLPTVKGLDADLIMRLSNEVGVGGTTIAGIRLKVGLPPGYLLESVRLAAADATFLVRDRPLLARVGDFFAGIARFLLLGRLVSAGTSLEIPAEAWYVLFEATPLGDSSVTLHTRDEIKAERGDANVTDHGAFQICRFLLAANAYSELVNVRIVVKNPRTHDVLRYHVPRLKLPVLPQPREGEETAPTKLSAVYSLRPLTAADDQHLRPEPALRAP